MKIPSRKQFDDYVDKHYNWQAMDQVFYHLCAMKPGGAITSFDLVNSRVQAIGLAYRCLFAAPETITKCLADRAVGPPGNWTFRWVSAQIRQLPPGPQITREGVENSMAVHGQICARIRDVVGRNLHSFVSKWLHFHRPGVPLYDSNAKRALGLGNSALYPRFCTELWSFADALGKPRPTVRDVDVYLYVKGRADR